MNSFKFFEMYITAATPYIRDIINSGHNARVKKKVLQASLLQKCLRRESKYTFLATALVMPVNMSLPFKLVIKNNTKVMMF